MQYLGSAPGTLDITLGDTPVYIEANIAYFQTAIKSIDVLPDLILDRRGNPVDIKMLPDCQLLGVSKDIRVNYRLP